MNVPLLFGLEMVMERLDSLTDDKHKTAKEIADLSPVPQHYRLSCYFR